MKIAIVCFNLAWQSGGPRLIFSSAQALKKSGHTVVIYTPEFTGEHYKELWRELDIRVVEPRHPFEWSGRPANLFQWISRKWRQERLRLDTARRIAEAMDNDFDALNVHDYAYLVGYFYKKRNSGAKILWTENDPPYMYLPKKNPVFDALSRTFNGMKDLTSKKYFRAIDRVAVLDFYNRTWCEDRGLRPVVVRLGVDPHFYLPVKNFEESAKAKRVRLFCLGSLNEYRHYEDALFALKFLRERGYDARALFICNDMWNEREYREKLLAIVKDNGLEDCVEFRFGGVSEEGLKEAYACSDVFVYAMYLPPPRNGYGFSIGVFEAMAAGLPVVLCRTTTSVEVLEDDKSALFVDPMSPEQIAEKAEFLIKNPDKYESIAAAGQKLVKENLTWDNYARNMLELVSGE